MQLSAVLLARAIALFETFDLNPQGKIFFPNLVPLLVERFSFQEYPQKPEQFDASKGITFKSGYFDGQAIEEFVVYNDGLKLDLGSSTEQAREMLMNTLEWLKDEVGINYSKTMIRRWGILSQLTFRSDMQMDLIHPAFAAVASEVSTEVNARAGLNLEYRASGLSFNFERPNGDIPIAAFLIERRGKALFSEDKYYSQAPLDTQSHIRVIEEFEESIRKSL
ncbi:MAG TPA: hypothetical protein VI320_03110 [Terracidiphilus sp.]|jgi:hypothetical protein